MAVVGNLQVRLTARTGPFRQQLKTAGTAVKRFEARVATATAAISRIGAVAGVAGTLGLAFFARSVAKSADEAGKAARRLGLASEQLIGLQHAAELSGVATRTFNMGLQRMVRRVAEAAKGTGEAKDAIKQLGLDAARLANMPADQQFLKIADAMQQVETQGERVRLAFKLFDSEGVALISMLEGGSEALQAAMRDAQMLGLTLSDIEIRQIEAANDAMTRLRMSFRGAATQLVARFAPVFERIVNLAIKYRHAILSTITTIAKLIAAFALVRAAMKAAAAAQAVLLSLAGPKGWAVLTGAAVAAATALLAIDVAFDKIEDSAAKAMAEVRGAADAMEELSVAELKRKGFQNLTPEEQRRVEAANAAEQTQRVLGPMRERDKQRRDFTLTHVTPFANELFESIKTFGLSAEEAKLKLLELSGEGQTTISFFSGLIGQLRELERAQGVKDLIESMDRQIATFGMASVEVARWEEAMKGATEAELAQIDARLANIKTLEDEAEARAKAASEAMRLEARAASIIEATRTPAERMIADLRELKELRSKGLIGEDTFARAIDQLRRDDADVNIQRSVSASVQTAIGSLNIAPSQDRRMERLEERQEKHLEDIEEHTRDMADVFRGITLLN